METYSTKKWTVLRGAPHLEPVLETMRQLQKYRETENIKLQINLYVQAILKKDIFLKGQKKMNDWFQDYKGIWYHIFIGNSTVYFNGEEILKLEKGGRY